MTIAFWCVFVGFLLPYVPFALVASKLDPKLPRLGSAKLEGFAARANGAHLNAFENFPPFAAAVIISFVVEGASSAVNVLAVIWLIARIAHIGFYLTDRSPLRSASFMTGVLMTAIIFLHTAFH
jgi:uncharacterized MAPEG superfamily protein